MIVVSVPGESAEKRSLREEQEQLTSKLVTLVSADIEVLTGLLELHGELQANTFPAFKTELLAGVTEIKKNLKIKLEYLRTGDIDSARHVRLVEYLANKYNIDNKIR